MLFFLLHFERVKSSQRYSYPDLKNTREGKKKWAKCQVSEKELERQTGAVCTDSHRCVFVQFCLLGVSQSEKTIWWEQLAKIVGCLDLSQFMLLSHRSQETCLIAILDLPLPISASNVSSGCIKGRERRRLHSAFDVLATMSGFVLLSGALRGTPTVATQNRMGWASEPQSWLYFPEMKL